MGVTLRVITRRVTKWAQDGQVIYLRALKQDKIGESMRSKAKTVQKYIAELPKERRKLEGRPLE